MQDCGLRCSVAPFDSRVHDGARRINELDEFDDVAARCDEEGDNQLEEMLINEGFSFNRGKTNLGLGRPSVEIAQARATVG